MSDFEATVDRHEFSYADNLRTPRNFHLYSLSDRLQLQYNSPTNCAAPTAESWFSSDAATQLSIWPTEPRAPTTGILARSAPSTVARIGSTLRTPSRARDRLAIRWCTASWIRTGRLSPPFQLHAKYRGSSTCMFRDNRRKPRSMGDISQLLKVWCRRRRRPNTRSRRGSSNRTVHYSI